MSQARRRRHSVLSRRSKSWAGEVTAVDESGPVTVPGQRPDRSTHIAGLVSESKNGSEQALGQLVTELSPLLWQVARAAGLGTDDAEDVLQTVWLRLVSHLGGIHTSGALTAWLVTTTKRESWRVRAAGRKQLPVDEGWLAGVADQAAGSEEQVIIDDDNRRLWHALSQL